MKKIGASVLFFIIVLAACGPPQETTSSGMPTTHITCYSGGTIVLDENVHGKVSARRDFWSYHPVGLKVIKYVRAECVVTEQID